MYFSMWVMLIAVSLGVSLAAFIWALSTGQFADQGRARYLPLSSEPGLPPARKPEGKILELYALGLIGLLALAGICASIILSIYWL